ncbi:MAG: hypothetical protein U0271_32585 [Polyangiaceae bacterium]
MARRSSTQKIRPWSQLPGVIAYIVLDASELITDAWGDAGGEDALKRARAFRDRVRSNRLDGSHSLERCENSQQLLSIARRDGWFVHVWLECRTDVAGILAVVGG